MRRRAQSVVVLMGLGFAIPLSGCTTRQIRIQGIGDICKQNVRVDIVGVSSGERTQWGEVPMKEYWSEKNNQRRRDANDIGYLALRMFEPGKTSDILIKETDPVWRTWRERQATHFFVMFDTCTDAERWRLCLPLSPKCWLGRMENNTIDVLIQPSGIVSKRAPSPKAACR